MIPKIYHELFFDLNDSYAESSVFKIFKRVYHEHFVIQDEKVQVIVLWI